MSEEATREDPSCRGFTLYDGSRELPLVYRRRARRELGEDPEKVPAHLEALRRWVESMPHITCPTGK